MALDTFRVIYGQILLRCPLAGPLLAQSWANNAFRRIAEKRPWSWLTGYGQALFQAAFTTGTVTVTNNSPIVIGNAAAAATWSAALVGQQFRVSNLTPLYDVIGVSTTTNPNDTLTLGAVWGGPAATAVGYKVYSAYFTAPADFLTFQTVIDPQRNWQLWANRWTQSDLNAWDAQRAAAGNPYAVVFRDYDPTGISSPPQARYEVWPHIQSQYVMPYLYVKRATDLTDSGATLPILIRGDVVVEGALADAYRWPGPSPDRKNPYYNPSLSQDQERRFQVMVAELERQDDEIFEQDIQYQFFTAGLPWAPFPADARWYQNHLMASSGGGW